MSLNTWLNNGWLKAHRPRPDGIARALAAADRALASCQIEGVAPEWRFNMAYSAILQVGGTALAAAGYRATRDLHHYRVLQSLRHTIGLDSEILDRLDKFRKKRHGSLYEGVGVSEQEVSEIVSLAQDTYSRVLEWLEKEHPDLLR